MSTQPETRTPPARDEEKLASNLRPIQQRDFKYEQARHLLWRAGFGGTPHQVQTLVGWGPERAVDYLLNAEADGAALQQFDKDIMRPPTEDERRMAQQARRSQNEEELALLRQMREQREREDRRQMTEIQKWWLKRMIETGRPLQEKMALFWHGHFATSYRTIENSYHMLMQNEMFRAKGLGNFGDLLYSIIRDPAMLAYLDNNDSRKGRANENLARELMELFSLGVGNYTERDIKEGARALTGYTFRDDEFVFERGNHDSGAKTILGATGNLDGDGFVKAILSHRACAPFIARRLYGFFVSDVPSDERGADRNLDPAQRGAIRDLASNLVANKYELKPTLRRLLLSEHFYERRFMNEQIKSPAVLVVGAVRSLNTPVRDLGILNDAMDLMGQNLFFPPSVKGWEGGRSWVNTSTMFVRQNIMAFLLTGKKPRGYDATADTQKYDPMPLLEELAKSDPAAATRPEAVCDYLLRLTIGTAPEHARRPLLEFMGSNGNVVNKDSVTGLLLLITTMPEYQLC